MGSALGRIAEEQPRYEVMQALARAAYELRAYEACCVVETSYDSARGMVRGDQGGSFMRLAKFIGVMSAPANDRREKIAMTSPVFMSPEGEDGAGRYVMQFVLPKSKFPGGASEAPAPTSDGVVVRDLPARYMAVRRFSGRMNEDLVMEEMKKLREALRADGVLLVNGESTPTQYAGYNPPWTPGPMRTNEVMVEIDPSSIPTLESATE